MSVYSMDTHGRYFKIETLGAVDGPGLRFVLFLQGCPLRCPYCHNPESRPLEGGLDITVAQVMDKLNKYKSYYRGGGITVSGGEPLMQAGFVEALFRRCAAEGIHTALDTSGCAVNDSALAAIQAADLILLDIKSPYPAMHQEQFGFPLSAAIELLDYCDRHNKDVWIRHVAVPGLTANEQCMLHLARLLEPHPSVKKVELLTFQKLCLEKYEQLGLDFPLADTPVLSGREMDALAGYLSGLLPEKTVACG